MLFDTQNCDSDPENTFPWGYSCPVETRLLKQKPLKLRGCFLGAEIPEIPAWGGLFFQGSLWILPPLPFAPG